ncbi:MULTISPECIES: hypothetical protein [unclassified Bosea (in: a-proteobacteria)]|uniref:hypothetical protein n=1 Tax=unclassified Bosea (in: a-proteobacteria) TaxID=2653178 RepID=UPI000F7D8D3D|nr:MULTISPECIES: hypothetical protein [unclassified Bosea (in: a-proteobacteria)]
MDEARIEHIARVLCRAARTDPDALVDAVDGPRFNRSLAPAVAGTPAWHRFRLAAQNFCEARDFLSIDNRPSAKA